MMNKKYLMRGFAALALVASVSSCTKDVTTMSQGEIDAKSKENAELQLGFSIPDGQTWDMASQVEANVTVNGDYGAKYTVSIYEQNPFQNNNQATVLGKAEVASGSTANISFTCPDAATMVFAAIKDERGYSYVKPAFVKNGKVEVVFGDDAAGSRAMRAASSTNSQVDIPTGTARATIEAQCATILAKSVEVNSTNSTSNDYAATKTVKKGTPTTYGWNWTVVYGQGNEVPQAARDYYVSLGRPGGITDEQAAYVISQGWSAMLNITPGSGDVVEWSTDYVTNFKISSEWNDVITVMGNVGQKVVSYHVDNESRLVVDEWEYVPKTVYITNGGKWIIGSGKTQTVGQGIVDEFVDAIIIVGNGGELQVNGTMNFANLARLIVLPGGRVTGTGSIQVNNGSKAGEESYNFGEISVATFNENGGNFFNYGTMTCTELQGGAGTSCYVNHGKVHVDHVYPNRELCANLQIKNNCWWEVDKWNYCKIFQNGSGAYAKFGSFSIGGGEGGENLGTVLAVDTNSSFVVDNESKMNGTPIYGPASGDAAYMEMGTFTYINVDGGPYVVSGKLNLNVTGFGGDNPTGFENAWNSYIAAGDGKPQVVGKAAFNTAPTDPSDCAPGFTPNIPVVVYETLKVYTYAFEDQTVGTDYDMNDVVLKVNYKVKSTGTGDNAGKVEYDKTKLAVKLVAAGATYNIKVKIGDTYLFGGEEIHNVLKVNGVAVGAGVMVNTGNGKATPATDEIDVPTGWNNDFTTLPVSIEVESTGLTYSYPNTDAYPHAIMVPTDWAWPLERINVKEAYPGTSDATKVPISGVDYPANSFAAWGGTPAADRTDVMKGWFNFPLSGKTMTNAATAE